MRYRRLGRTGLEVSEIGLGGEWLERHNTQECLDVIKRCEDRGINILDCWMSEPNVRSNIGLGIKENRGRWIVQGHIGSTWQNGQYTRTRDMEHVVTAFEDLLTRLQTDYLDLGMIHYVDTEKEWEYIQDSPYLEYVFDLKDKGVIRHIGLSTHNPLIALKAARCGYVEMLMFSVNPAFDMLPPNDDLESYYLNLTEVEGDLSGIAPERAELYSLCESEDIGLTVMKGYAGGRLFSAETSPFGVALTPVQCLHYALTRPAVASVLVGYDTPEHVDEAVHYEDATDEEKDYATVLANAPRHSASGQCTYCGHCKPCPMDIDIAMVNKLYDLASMHEEIPGSVRDHYLSLEHKAGECIGCRGCEERCPFGVEIADRMEKTAGLFSE